MIILTKYLHYEDEDNDNYLKIMINKQYKYLKQLIY